MRAMLVFALLGVACRGSSPQSDGGAPPPESEAPVALNPDVPIAYPPPLYDRKIEGDVTLRLFVDSTGKLVPESTRVAEPSGYAALDSAAVTGSKALKFAPAKRRGVPVATAFLQPVEFRQVGTTRTGGGGTVTLPPPPAPLPTAPPAPAQSRPQPPPPAPVVRARPDTTRADSTKRADSIRVRTDSARPKPPAPPPPPPPDTTKARTDTSATTH